MLFLPMKFHVGSKCYRKTTSFNTFKACAYSKVILKESLEGWYYISWNSISRNAKLKLGKVYDIFKNVSYVPNCFPANNLKIIQCVFLLRTNLKFLPLKSVLDRIVYALTNFYPKRSYWQ